MTLAQRSASSTRRWLHCGLSVRLPQEEQTVGTAAVVGTRFHGLVEAAIESGAWVQLEPLDEHFEHPLRSTLEWFSAKLPGDATIHTEQAFELQPLGTYVLEHGTKNPRWKGTMHCTALPKAGHREYPNSTGAVYGTADVVIVHKGGVHVIDWKTGQKSDDHDFQLRTLGLMASRAYNHDHVIASAVYVNLKSGKVTEKTTILDSFDLHVHASQIVDRSLELLRKELPEPTPGKYCFFCPAIGCPEKLRTTR